MTDYRHILLATDFSDPSDRLAWKAKHIADRHHAHLSIVHVLDDIPMPDTNYGTVIELDKDSSYHLLESEKLKLIQLGRRLNVKRDRLWLVWGVPKLEIPRLAESQNVDLIMVGAHGRHGLTMLLGSTANGVLHHAKCDVLAIRLL
ncbi:MAG: universal stress protein [Gammaproteobacteria bacterium]